MDRELIQWDEFERQIDAAKDLKTIVQMQEQLKAIAIIVKQVDGSRRAGNKCKKYQFDLEQRAGKIYKDTPKERGDEKYIRSLRDGTTETTKQQIEKETGKHRSTLNTWAKESEVEKDISAEYEAVCNEENKDFTSKGTMRYAKGKEEKPEALILPDDTYMIVYADPPWKYGEEQDKRQIITPKKRATTAKPQQPKNRPRPKEKKP